MKSVIELFTAWFKKKYSVTQNKRFQKELFWAFNAGFDAGLKAERDE